MFSSRDGGATWSPLGGNSAAHVVLAPSMAYPDDWEFWTFKEMRNYGFFHPSNIVEQNSFYYATAGYVHRTASNEVDALGSVLLRTSSLTSAKGWAVWNGIAYVPIPTSWDAKLPMLPGIPGGDGLMSTISWSFSVCQYIILFTGSTGARFATTPSLESPQLSALKSVEGGAGLSAQNYPILQDDTFPGLNFHAIMKDSAYMYSVRQNGGLDRDVIKQQVVLSSGSGPSPSPPGPGPPGPSPGPPVHAIYRCLLPTGAHFTSTAHDCERAPGATMEFTLGYVSNSKTPGTHGLYRCQATGDHFVSIDPGCEGVQADGILGYAWAAPSTVASVALYRCLTADGMHFTSTSSICEGGGKREAIVGYARSSAIEPPQ